MEQILKNKLFGRIKTVDFQENNYYSQVFNKVQFYIHHNAGWDNVRGMFNMWKDDGSKVSTFAGIENDGTMLQAFPSEYGGWHLGVSQHLLNEYGSKVSPWELNMKSIGAELTCFGRLKEHNGKFYAWPGWENFDSRYEIPKDRVQEYNTPFRGACFYEKYTDDELETLRLLLLYFYEKYGIPLDFKPNMFELNADALNGEPGIWGHVSVRPEDEKFDPHPQPELIEMLKGLTNA